VKWVANVYKVLSCGGNVEMSDAETDDGEDHTPLHDAQAQESLDDTTAYNLEPPDKKAKLTQHETLIAMLEGQVTTLGDDVERKTKAIEMQQKLESLHKEIAKVEKELKLLRETEQQTKRDLADLNVSTTDDLPDTKATLDACVRALKGAKGP
jgi:chromosome segregation ATPase